MAAARELRREVAVAALEVEAAKVALVVEAAEVVLREAAEVARARSDDLALLY
jgi:hypothetical protein